MAWLLGGSDAAWPARAPHRQAVPRSFDCAMRRAAYAYGATLLPRLAPFPELYSALGLDVECGGGAPPRAEREPYGSSAERSRLPPDAVFVSPEVAKAKSSTSKLGSLNNPFTSIQKAADAAAASASKTVGTDERAFSPTVCHCRPSRMHICPVSLARWDILPHIYSHS